MKQVMTLPFPTLYLVLLALLWPAGSHGADQPQEGDTSSGRVRLVVAQDAGYPPFCFLDPEGEPAGYLVDLWQAFGDANDVEIVFRLGTWQESLDMVLNGEADVHGGLVHSDERDRVYDFGPDLVELSTHLHVRKGRDPHTVQPVGVVRGGYEEHSMRANRPGTPLVLFDDNIAMIGAASRGEIPAFVADTPTVSACLGMFDSRDDFVRADLFYRKPLRAAVAEGRHETLNLVTYGWTRMDQKVLARIHGKWFVDTSDRPPWLMGGVLIALLVMVLGFAVRAMTRRYHRPAD